MEKVYKETAHTREGRRFTWIYPILEKGEGLLDISNTREGRRFKWIYPILEKGEGSHGYIPY